MLKALSSNNYIATLPSIQLEQAHIETLPMTRPKLHQYMIRIFEDYNTLVNQLVRRGIYSPVHGFIDVKPAVDTRFYFIQNAITNIGSKSHKEGMLKTNDHKPAKQTSQASSQVKRDLQSPCELLSSEADQWLRDLFDKHEGLTRSFFKELDSGLAYLKLKADECKVPSLQKIALKQIIASFIKSKLQADQVVSYPHLIELYCKYPFLNSLVLNVLQDLNLDWESLLLYSYKHKLKSLFQYLLNNFIANIQKELRRDNLAYFDIRSKLDNESEGFNYREHFENRLQRRS